MAVYCLLPMDQDFFLLQQASCVLERSLVDMGSVVHTWWCRYVMDVALWAHQNFPSVSLWPKWLEVFTWLLKRLIPFHISMFYVRLTSHIVPRILTLITTKVWYANAIDWVRLYQRFCLVGKVCKNSQFSFSFFFAFESFNMWYSFLMITSDLLDNHQRLYQLN